LKQRNLDVLENALLDVSNPHSENYGKWWTHDQIINTIAPPKDQVDALIAYLSAEGFTDLFSNGDYIRAKASVRLIESVFNIEMHHLKHKTGVTVTRTAGEYTIPASMSDLVEVVGGIADLPVVPKGPRSTGIFNAGGGDAQYIIPQTLQSLYSIPSTFPTHVNSSLCLAEFQNDTSFSKKDLTTFSTNTDTPLIKVDTIVGTYTPSDPDLEATLDVQYGGSIALNSSIWYWTEPGWMLDFANRLFEADPFPLVVSMSWGWDEPAQCSITSPKCQNSYQYVVRSNAEFLKVTMKGISLLAASGDQGAPGDGNPSCSTKKAPISTIFPGASPYVTSVGATMLSTSAESSDATAPICSKFKCATSTTEVVCTYPEALITTGGGFSDYAALPSWQSSVVNAYLQSGVTLPESKYFNATNRAFPDVSALGHNYLIVAQGDWTPVDGTSCSTPVTGAIVSLLNSARLNAGKAPLGFVAPLFYAAAAANANAFNDIVGGNNYCSEDCCGKVGYIATKGWDPVTGLGTPNFPALLSYVESLN